jgi:hypothetical protein
VVSAASSGCWRLHLLASCWGTGTGWGWGWGWLLAAGCWLLSANKD